MKAINESTTKKLPLQLEYPVKTAVLHAMHMYHQLLPETNGVKKNVKHVTPS
jgi:hypothetical protein